MRTVRTLALYVDRSSQQWVVRDHEGNLWSVPAAPDGWDQRQPYYPTEETELEPIPAHYRDTLGLP
jgi:hypothetical protein